MRINFASVMVDDQDKALHFYTEVLGFEKKSEIPMGEFRWLTVTSAEDPNGTELVLEPTTTRRHGRSRRRSSPTVSRSPRLPSETYIASSPG
jgi:catechol 2,3-dioxygenase-like lactoylglutathione lyase family enzyme